LVVRTSEVEKDRTLFTDRAKAVERDRIAEKERAAMTERVKTADREMVAVRKMLVVRWIAVVRERLAAKERAATIARAIVALRDREVENTRTNVANLEKDAERDRLAVKERATTIERVKAVVRVREADLAVLTVRWMAVVRVRVAVLAASRTYLRIAVVIVRLACITALPVFLKMATVRVREAVKNLPVFRTIAVVRERDVEKGLPTLFTMAVLRNIGVTGTATTTAFPHDPFVGVADHVITEDAVFALARWTKESIVKDALASPVGEVPKSCSSVHAASGVAVRTVAAKFVMPLNARASVSLDPMVKAPTSAVESVPTAAVLPWVMSEVSRMTTIFPHIPPEFAPFPVQV
jgi:hypothetical protein